MTTAVQLALPLSQARTMLPKGCNHCPNCGHKFSIRRCIDRRVQICTECDWWAGDSSVLNLARGVKVA